VKSLNKRTDKQILVDAREFTPGRLTGIGRVIEGLIDALAERDTVMIVLAVFDPNAVPSRLKNRQRIKIKKVPASFLKSERALSMSTRGEISLFFSPYPKLPFFGTHCHTINMVHDVLDLTHPAYKKRTKPFFDSFRLKRALQKSDLTWYVSNWSLEETTKYAGFTGKNPRVRYNGIDEKFTPNRGNNDFRILEKYRIKPDYILVLGNGLPHKNLGVLLKITHELNRQIFFAGVSSKNQAYWKSRYSGEKAVWISHVMNEDLPSIIRSAFCLAQPSTMEGYGYPPLEAMACGVPAIVSNIPVLKETTGGNALYVDPTNPKDWTESILVLENQDLYQEQIEKGLNWIEPLKGRKGWLRHIADVRELIY
jgi:glycosyltransferase involved in cell wall biosynthesis